MNEAATDTAYNKMLELIFSKQFMPGEKISENVLVEKLNLSRTPIRHALKQLENDGLVDICPKCYTSIAKYTDDYIKQIGIVRVGLDITAVNLAILNGSNADFARLEKIHMDSYKALENNNIELKIVYDCDFHQEISNISKNEILKKLQKEVYLKVRFIMTHADFEKNDKLRSLNMHDKLLRSLKDRDQINAIRCVKQHLYDFYNLSDELTNITYI